eukprot:1326471-Lingulodinium_polyedra.AAC.1
MASIRRQHVVTTSIVPGALALARCTFSIAWIKSELGVLQGSHLANAAHNSSSASMRGASVGTLAGEH